MDELSVVDTVTTGKYKTLDLPCDTSTHTELLSKKDLPIEARKTHLFPGLNKSLLSIGNVFDHGCQEVFNDKTVLILNKGTGKIMMKGKRYPPSNLYMLDLNQRNNLMTEFQTPDKYFTGSVYECKSKGSWPGLSYDLVLKYLTKKY